MKKRNKKVEINWIEILSSFFVGVLLTLIICFIGMKEVERNNTSSLASATEKIQEATVTIESYNGTAVLSTGSGFVYKKKGSKAYILTNEHVLSGEDITVTNQDMEEAKAKVLGKDSNLDLAVIEIDKKYAEKVATLGDSTKTKIGDTIMVVGSPISKRYQGSVSSGILSGRDRIVQTLGGEEENTEWLMKVLQLDAAVNPGNSGGPVVNAKGEVIGICTMKLIKEEIEGMSFAIPIETAKKYLENLEKGKEVEWPELGISMVDVNATAKLLEEDIEIPSEITEGVVVLSTKKKSSADNKLKKGDILLEMDGIKITETPYVKYVLYQHSVGDKIKVKVIRNQKEKNITITLKKAS